MKTPSERTEGGQVAVHVAVMMVVLIMAIALAVDIGHVLQRRRQMQNAADAGALAGAFDICFGDLTRSVAQTHYEARVAAVVDARANGADKAVATFPMTWTVNVTTTEKASTFFLNIIGMSTLDVGASARATCGMAKSGCGLWPVTIDVDRYTELYDLGQGCDTEFWVWSGDTLDQAPDCTLVDCDWNDDGIDDFIDSQDRAYVDYSLNVSKDFPDPCSQTGCGAAELACWVVNDSGGKVTLPSCIAGTTGVIASIKDDVNARATPFPDAVAIPLYETVDVCNAPVCPGGHAYWIKKFACINVLGWYQNLELDAIPPATKKWKGKVIRASINCSLNCGTYCGGTAGQPPDPSGLRAVSLVK